MNTVAKGDLFEARAFTLIQKFVDDGNIPLLKEYCVFQQKSSYYSENRKGNIIFDISIEVTPKGALSYHLLYLVECKDYKQKIPVNKIEEFKAKVDQVSGKNVKGVFISTGGFQTGAYDFAQSNGIMLIHVHTDDTADILLHNARNHWKEDTPQSWSDQIKNSKANHDDYQNIDWDREIENIFIHLFNPSTNTRAYLPSLEPLQKLSKSIIQSIAIQILNSLDPNISKGISQLDPKKFLAHIHDTYGIQIIDDINISNIRGLEVKAYCSLKTKKIFIDPKLRDEDNFLFVCMHEMAHIFLHSNINITQEEYDAMEMSKYNELAKKHDLLNDKNWMEWQANYFASVMLMPKDALYVQLYIWQKLNGINRVGKVYLDNQSCNKLDYSRMTEKLSSFFNVSKAMLKYRMDELDLVQYSSTNPVNWKSILNENNEPELIGDIMRRMFCFR